MNDVIYEAKVEHSDPMDEVFHAGCMPSLIMLLFSAVSILVFGVFAVILLAVALYFVIRHFRQNQAKKAKEGILQRIAVTEDTVILRYGRGGLNGIAPYNVEILLEQIVFCGSPENGMIRICTAEKTYELNEVTDAPKLAAVITQAKHDLNMKQRTPLYQPIAELPADPQAGRLFREEQRERVLLAPQSEAPVVITDMQNAMTHLLRTGAITQAQFDLANDPDRLPLPQPVVKSDEQNAFDFQQRMQQLRAVMPQDTEDGSSERKTE